MKVQLINEGHSPWFWRNATPIKRMLPFYEREGSGYVHRVRSASHHYDLKGALTHTGVHFWCGGHGFLYPVGKKPRKRGGRLSAQLLSQVTPGRVLCATCQARAIGSGQIGKGRIEGEFVRFKPHFDFYPQTTKPAEAGSEGQGA